MAIIRKYKIQRYKQVTIDLQSGNIEDGGFSTFQLDDPSMLLNPPNGTSDFFGTVKRVVLLGEVVRETLDTGNVGIGQFNQLTQQDFENQLQLGNFTYNRENNGQPTVIGWVELGETYPSFYYEDCITGTNMGKTPVSENYYDLDYFDVSPYTVSGDGAAALQQIGNWDYGNSFGNWGLAPFPGQEPLTLQGYIVAVLNGGTLQGGNVPTFPGDFLGNLLLNQIPLLIADYSENFERNTTYTISPSFAKNNGMSKNVYGRIRRTINSGFIPFGGLDKNSGLCISTGVSISVVGPSTGTGVSPNAPSGPRNVTSVQFGGDLSRKLYVDCFESLKIDFDGIQNTLTKSPDNMGAILQFGEVDASNNTDDIREYNFTQAVRQQIQLSKMLYNIRDPRQIYNDNINIPSGILRAYLNDDKCTATVIPAYLNKDGQIPEPIGPHREYNNEEIREYLQSNYGFYDKTLFEIGKNQNGIMQYSDGLSFREYTSTSAWGWHSSRYSAHYLMEYSGNQTISFSLKIPTREEINRSTSQGLFGNSSATFLYENKTWKSIIDLLSLAKESSNSFIKKDGKSISLQLPDITYKKVYDSDFVKVIVYSKTRKYFSINQTHSTIFLGFNDNNTYSYQSYGEFLTSLNKTDILSNNQLLLSKRNIQYGKNPLEKLGVVKWTDLSRFNNPNIRISPNGSLYIELTDGTYLLDIYHSLMNLHLAQVGWDTIMKYIKKYETLLLSGTNDFESLYEEIQEEEFLRKNRKTDILDSSNQTVWPPSNDFSFDEFGILI